MQLLPYMADQPVEERQRACSGVTGGTTAEIRGTRRRRLGVLFRRIRKTRGTYVDPMFARPDLVEDDYYRFRRPLDS